VKKASEAGAAALFLPEAADYINTNPSLKLCKSVDDSEFVQGLLKSAREYRMPIQVGIHEPAAGDKTKNTLIWIDEEGKITNRYQKVHLFDVDISGGPSLQESKSVERGNELPQPYETALGKIGPQICFDMRYPEPGLVYAKRGAHIITYPAAFTTETGKAGHWHILLRARAIETQSYIIAAGQVGQHDEEGKRHSYGHSLIIDPWGKVVAELGGEADEQGRGLDECEICVAEIDIEYVERIRKEIPLARRGDVYPELK
jgi:predicted amidohydrolase